MTTTTLHDNEINIFTLKFRDRELEAAFDADQMAWARRVSPITVVGAMIAFTLYGLLDVVLVTPEMSATLWQIRLTFVVLAASVLFIATLPIFERIHQLIACFSIIVGYVAMMLPMALVPEASYVGYYVALIQVVVFSFLTLGAYHRYAVVFGVTGLVAYFALFGYFKPLNTVTLLTHGFFMFSAVVIAASGSYNLERARRELFVRELRVRSAQVAGRDLAAHDMLTGLDNRLSLETKLAELIALDPPVPHCGFVIDLSGFRRLNDKLGRDQGDVLLQATAAALSAQLAEATLIGRTGGDEFFIALQGVSGNAEIAEQVERIKAAVESVVIDVETDIRLPSNLSANVGSAKFPYVDATAKDVFRRADHSLHQSKNAMRTQALYAAVAASD